MAKIKLCGLTRPRDIDAVNALMPEYIGFVFAPKSRRYVPAKRASELKERLNPGITAVGVFVREAPETVAGLLNAGVIDIAQLHGGEDEAYIRSLRAITDKPVIKAFRVETEQDILAARDSSAEGVLLDSGAGGTGTVFDWTLIQRLERPYFLAGGLGLHNIQAALDTLHPYAVDVSSGIETDGLKDRGKMETFVRIVRTNAERKK